MNDIIIIGGGPAGLTAALYAGRAKMKTILIEKSFQGGQMLNTDKIENYPGIKEITGYDISNSMFEHAKEFGTEIIFDEVLDIQIEDDMKSVITPTKTYKSKVVILSMGTKPRELGLEKEQELLGRGISYCATCDGGFYKDKVVAVVGGGDVAVGEALYLSRIAKKVFLIHRGDSLKAAKYLQKKLFDSKVEMLWDNTITKLYSSKVLTGIKVTNTKNYNTMDLDISGLFIAIGGIPTSNIVKDIVGLNPGGYIITDKNCSTNVKGLFAIGDIREKQLRQVVTAVADGAVSIDEAQKYL